MLKNKNSNTYIILYATVMVIVVAAILATTAMVLKPLQEANVLMEKQSAILGSLGAEGKEYNKFIMAYALDNEGEVITSIKSDDVLDMLSDLKGSHVAGQYPIFVAADGRVVIPVFGQGLWNILWGYVALESDMNTISGIVLDHAGETPGLGAEIATDVHQSQYRGKKIFNGAEFVAVTLVKGGASPSSSTFEHEVDGISGGTKTADGVTDMLKNSLKSYIPYLKKSLEFEEEEEEVQSEEEEVVEEEEVEVAPQRRWTAPVQQQAAPAPVAEPVVEKAAPVEEKPVVTPAPAPKVEVVPVEQSAPAEVAPAAAEVPEEQKRSRKRRRDREDEQE